ncbi:MAG TPA: molybdenum cofactor guanylyltransferase [Devosia sp.]
MTRVAAVILAGGRGERLGGVIKADLTIGGMRLLDRVAAVLAGADALLVARGSLDLDLPRGAIGVADLPTDYAGPLGGLAAAVDWVRQQQERPDILVLAPVDTPFLPPDYLALLAAPLATAPVAVAAFAGQPYPTSSAWWLAAITDLPDAVRAGTAPHSLKRLAESLGAVPVDFPPRAGGDPFANANTPEELRALERRAAS